MKGSFDYFYGSAATANDLIMVVGFVGVYLSGSAGTVWHTNIDLCNSVHC